MASWQDYLGLLGYGAVPGGILGPVDLSAVKASMPSLGPVAPDAANAPANNGDFWSTKNPDGTTSILGGLFNYDPTKDTGRGDRLGLLGAAFADAGAQFGGHPEAAVNLSRYDANRKKQAGQALLMDALNGMSGTTPAAIPAQQQAVGAPLGSGGGLATEPQKPIPTRPGSAPGPTSGPVANGRPDPADQQAPNAPAIPQPFALRDMLPKLARAAAAGVDVSPIVSLLKDAQPKYSQDVHWTGDGKPYVMADDGTPKFLDPSLTPREKIEIAGNGAAYNPYQVQPGADFSDRSKPFDSATGAPIKSVQDWEIQKAKAGRNPPGNTGWTVVNDPTTGQPYRYNANTAQTTDMQGKPIQVGGYGKITTNNPRSAIGIYMEQWKQEHPKASAADVATAMNIFAGQQSEQRTLGTISGKVGSANNGLDRVLDMANEAYGKLGRTGFVPFNKLQQMATTDAFSTPEQADAYAADTAAINMWAKAINPSGVLTVENARRGEQMLSNATSPEAHAAVIARMRKEGAASVAGVNQSRGINTAPPAPAPQSLPRLNPPAGTSGGVKWRIIPQGGR
jgi:hypothetical protein